MVAVRGGMLGGRMVGRGMIGRGVVWGRRGGQVVEVVVIVVRAGRRVGRGGRWCRGRV